MTGIDVAFGGVHALRDFALTVEPREVHGLIGPNGAGKTTAINVMTGLVRPSAGTLELDGTPFVPRARGLVARGVARTFQTPAIFPDLSALDNVLVGGYSAGRSGLFGGSVRSPATIAEERALAERARTWLARVGFEDDPAVPARSLAFGAHRKIEVARALMTQPRFLLLDEPTAGLAAAEVARFAALLRMLRDEHGVTILLVEHNVPFVFGLCDRVTAMHEGARIADGTPEAVRRNPAVVESYLGEAHEAQVHVLERPIDPGAGARDAAAMLDVRDVVSGYGATTIIRGATLHVAHGEAVALFGRNGAGKSTLLNTIAGWPRARSGTITWHGADITRHAPERIVASGIGLVPQERSVIARQSVDDNLLLATFGLRLSKAEIRARIDDAMTRFPRLAERRTQLAGSLSGGERQMLAIAKVLMRKPSLLMLDEPSIGLAPSIVDEVQAIVGALRSEGLPVLIAEQNVTWVVPIADRAYLIDTGAIVEEGAPATLADAGALAERYLGAG